MVSHKAVISEVSAYEEIFYGGRRDEHIYANSFSYSSISSVGNLFLTIRLCYANCLFASRILSGTENYIREMEEKKITDLHIPVSELRIISEHSAIPEGSFKELKRIFTAGEPANKSAFAYWTRKVKGLKLFNIYGATETMGTASYHLYDMEKDDMTIAIGKAIRGIKLLVCDDEGKEIYESNTEHAGELYIGGDKLAYGYLNDEKLTAEKFVQNPLHDDYRDVVYRTGDNVRYNKNGELVYVGRKDNQIEHHGHRIEMEEVERIVCTLEGIKECGCVYDTENEQLILFYAGTVDEMTAHKMAHDTLPRYKVPSRFQRLEEMPHNLNGK